MKKEEKMKENKNKYNEKNLVSIITALQENGLIFEFDINLVYERKISLYKLSQIVNTRFNQNLVFTEEEKEKNKQIPNNQIPE